MAVATVDYSADSFFANIQSVTLGLPRQHGLGVDEATAYLAPLPCKVTVALVDDQPEVGIATKDGIEANDTLIWDMTTEIGWLLAHSPNFID